MSKMNPLPNWQYTREFKVESVRLAESVGGNEAAKRLGIPDSSLWNWVRLHRAGKLACEKTGREPVERSASELEAENARLRRELANTKCAGGGAACRKRPKLWPAADSEGIA